MEPENFDLTKRRLFVFIHEIRLELCQVMSWANATRKLSRYRTDRRGPLN